MDAGISAVFESQSIVLAGNPRRSQIGDSKSETSLQTEQSLSFQRNTQRNSISRSSIRAITCFAI